MNRVRFSFIVVTTCVATAAYSPLFAASGDVVTPGGIGSLTVNQTSELEGYIGNWTLIEPYEGTQTTLVKKKAYTNDQLPSGKYTIIVTKPTGTSLTMKVRKNGDLISTDDSTKVTFILGDNETVVVDISYQLARTGVVSVTSSPPGVPYSLAGPNGTKQKGVTPDSITEAPEGTYSVTFYPFEGCGTPITKTDQLKKGSRASFTISFSCAAADEIRSQEQSSRANFVSLTIGGTLVVFDDAPLGDWYASYVFNAARSGIMSGYKNEDGTFSGKFAPGDNVSLAQLAKIAHEIASLNEAATTSDPLNAGASDTWFTQYWASAEAHHWQAFLNPEEDPNRPATRAEVVATMLQALNVSRLWPKGTVFADVSFETQYADCIETAAHDGIINGSAGAEGSLLEFRPNDPINRAEMAKLVSVSMETYLKNTPEVTGESWQ